MKDLAAQTCNSEALPLSAPRDLLDKIDHNWHLGSDGKSLLRSFTFKGFAKATSMANLAAFIGDRAGHHADIAFGWGYCNVTFRSHDAGGLTQNDFICAAKLDRAIGQD